MKIIYLMKEKVVSFYFQEREEQARQKNITEKWQEATGQVMEK
jgi:hypothetical protein